MALADYLCPETIAMDLRSEKRNDSVRALLERLVSAGKVRADLLDAAVRAILAREELGSTALGNGVAVPHARLDELDGVVMAFGYSRCGVQFKALDGELVHEIFLIMAPGACNDEYMAVLQRVARLVGNGDFRRFLAGADSSDTVLALIEEMDV